MCAVDICTHTGGGFSTFLRARPRTVVVSTRERRISSQCSGVLTQSTVRPAKLTNAAAPSKCDAQAPTVRPSHVAWVCAREDGGGRREIKTTS